MQRNDYQSGGPGEDGQGDSSLMSLRQRWPTTSVPAIPPAAPPMNLLAVPMCTLCRNGHPIVGMPGLEGADVQAVAAHGLVPAQHSHVNVGNKRDSPSAALQPGLESRDSVGVVDMPNRVFFVGGNAAGPNGVSPGAIARAASSTSSATPGYMGFMQDRKQIPLELGMSSGSGGGIEASPLLVPHQPMPNIMLGGAVAREQNQEQILQGGRGGLPIGFSRAPHQTPNFGGVGLFGLPDNLVGQLVGQKGQSPMGVQQPISQTGQMPQSPHMPQNPMGVQQPISRSSRKEPAEEKNWFVFVIDEARRSERGYKLLEIFGSMRLDNSCSAIEWRRAELGGVSFDAQTFVQSSTFPAQLALGADLWVPVRTIHGKVRGAASDLHFLMVEQEEHMVAQLYKAGSAGLRGQYDHSDQKVMEPLDHRGFSRVSGEGGQRMQFGGHSDGPPQSRAGEKRPAEAGVHDALLKKGRGRKSSDGRGHGGREDWGEGEERRGKNPDGEWRCEVCNIIFSSSQALGGHRINSTDHKQNLSRLRRQEQEGASHAPGEARLSKHVYSNPPPEDPAGSGRRARLPSMAQMPGFLRVLRAFPIEVGTDICVSQSPTAYFSSCRLELFRRHTTFGALGSLIIDKYFTECWLVFEKIILDPKGLPELADVGIDAQKITEEQLQDLMVFMRMLRTKKKSLDINRRAVSKRIKGLQTDGGGSPASPGNFAHPGPRVVIEDIPDSGQVDESPSSSKPFTTSP